MDEDTLRDWTFHTMDQYDRLGLNHAARILDEADRFIGMAQDKATGVILGEYKAILLPFLRGLSGRTLDIESSDALAYTDTGKLYFPAVTTLLQNKNRNFKLLKTTLTFLWAQIRYGSFSMNLLPDLKALTADELQWYGALEAQRLMAILSRELPGLFRQMNEIIDQLNLARHKGISTKLLKKLTLPGAAARDSLVSLDKVKLNPPPPALPFQGEIRLEEIEQMVLARTEREKAYLRVRLAEHAEEQGIASQYL